MIDLLFRYNLYTVHSFLAFFFLIPVSLVYLFVINRVASKRITPFIGFIFLCNGLMNLAIFFTENLVASGTVSVASSGDEPLSIALFTLYGIQIMWVATILFLTALIHFSFKLLDDDNISKWHFILLYFISAVLILLVCSGLMFQVRTIPLGDVACWKNPTPWMPHIRFVGVIALPVLVISTSFVLFVLIRRYLHLKKVDDSFRKVILAVFSSIGVVLLFIIIDLLLWLVGILSASIFPIGTLISGILLLYALILMNCFSLDEMKNEIQLRRQAEIDLQKTRHLLEESSIVSLVLEGSLANWNVVFVSGNVDQIFGYTRDDLTTAKSPFEDIIYADDYELIVSRLVAAVNNGRNELIPLPMRIICKDRTIKWFNSKISLRRTSSGVFKIECILFDITEIKSLELQLFQSQKIETLGRHVSSISHDFNNMIQGILGYGELIMRSIDKDSRVHGYAVNVVEASKKAQALASRLLAFGRNDKVKFSIINIHKVIIDFQRVLASMVPESIDFKLSLDAPNSIIQADLSRFEQVLINLVVNSVDAIDVKGKITISTINVSLDESHTTKFKRTVHPGEYLKLICDDTGCGISKEELMNVFEPFYTTKERGKGTGLGLSTVSSIIDSHNGLIYIESVLEQGTSFELYFPLKSKE